MELSGHIFRPLSSKQEKASIRFADGKATILSVKDIVCADAEIDSIQAKKDIYLKNGLLFKLDNELKPEQEKQLLGKWRWRISWLEDFSFRKAIILSLILLSVIVFFRYTLTAITPVAVAMFPNEWEEAIGQNTYETLQKTLFEESNLSPVRIARLREKTGQLAMANEIEATEILFHKSDSIGPNALAFAGGPVVITDDLVLLLQRDDLILAVIAHELAHIQKRHSLHQIIEVLGATALASVLLGADESLVEEASFIGVNLWASKKSRDFEKEADLTALAYLDKTQIGHDAFAKAIKKLTEYSCSSVPAQSVQNCLNDTDSGWLSSHPTGAKRLQYISEYHGHSH